jgi:Fe-S-cluster-containing hydrogenase component 2
MKKYLKTFPEKCIACKACESVCSNLYFKQADAARSCIRITESGDANTINVCNQCQACVSACPTLALTVNAQGVVMLNKSLCIGCYMCVAACPTQSMMIYPGGKSPFKCIACGMCAKSCPVEAIKIVQE